MDTKLRIIDRMGNTLQTFTLTDGSLPIVEVDTSDGHTFRVSYWAASEFIEVQDQSGRMAIEPISGNRIRLHPAPESGRDLDAES
jgi:hypothetical protein